MIYDNFGAIPTNNSSSIFPQYITLNNYYINNNKIRSPIPNRNNRYDNYGMNINNNNHLIHGNYGFDSPYRVNNLMTFFSPQKEITQSKSTYFSPPPNKPFQNFENIFSKIQINPPEIAMVTKIKRNKIMSNANLEVNDGPKDHVKNYQSNLTYSNSLNVLNNNVIKSENFNYNNVPNRLYAKHPLDNSINLLKRYQNSNKNIKDINPKDNFKYYTIYNMNQKFGQSNAKIVNKTEKRIIDEKNYDGITNSNTVYNLKGQINRFNTNEKEIGKNNMINNKTKIYNVSEVKRGNNYNVNKGKIGGKDSKKNIIIKEVRKININNLNNNIQNKLNLKEIEDAINKGEIKKGNINKDKIAYDNNMKSNIIKDDKNFKKLIKRDLNKEKKYKIIKVNNEIKNRELNHINKIIGKINGLKNKNTEQQKDKFISNYNQDKSQNKSRNNLNKTEIKENNSMKYNKSISNIEKNNIFNSSQIHILNTDITEKSNINEKNLKIDDKIKINENDSQNNKVNENNPKINENKLPKKDIKEISPELYKKKIDIVQVPKIDIIEDKDNINEFCGPNLIEDSNKNINNENQKGIIENTSNGSLKFKKKKKLLYIVDLDERMSRFLNNKNLLENNDNNNIRTFEETKNKEKEHKDKFYKPQKEEKIFDKIKKSFQIPVETSEFLLNPDSYKYLGVIGEGEYGKIYLAQNIEDNQYYAMKIQIFENRGEAHKRQVKTKMIKDVLKKTNSQGIIKIYGDIWLKRNNLYNYYVLMEKAEIDMEQELIIRYRYKKYYTERELINVLYQLIVACAQLQRNNIAHRDIKPQNILILKGRYKLCDFGESKLINKGDVIIQRIRGSELYMSPILFFGMKNKFEHVKHNVYKSDVFSLGLSILLAGSLNYDSICRIRELTDMEKIKIVIINFLSKRYSISFISFLFRMLEVNENKRPNFLELEKILIKQLI